ncbi:hypothetical protein BX600DRAFT_437056 [Xylariales sp. PMI_506]|nr:hypothetical protein BX600DRAFT_437056 [Xylariales sp. PMI_506]
MWAWTSEVACAGCCLGVFAGIVLLLGSYDGQIQPRFYGDLTLNVVLQFMVIICQTLLVAVASGGLAAHKWIWFSSRRRPISDFLVFEEACQSYPLSLWKLLMLRKGDIFQDFFASFLMQQLVTYQVVPRASLNGTATARSLRSRLEIVSSLAFIHTLTKTGQLDYATELATEKALLEGVFHDFGSNIPFRNPVCSSGDCTWNPYETLGICSSIINATGLYSLPIQSRIEDYLTTELRVDSASLYSRSEPFPVNAIYTFEMVVRSDIFKKSLSDAAVVEWVIAFSNSELLLSNDSAIESMVSNFQYFGVLFHWCTKTLVGKVSAGVPTILEQASAVDVASTPPDSLYIAWNSESSDITSWDDKLCRFDDPTGGLVLNSQLDSGSYTVGKCLGLLTSLAFQSVLWGHMLRGSELQFTYGDGEIISPFSVALWGGGRNFKITDPTVKLNNVRGVVDNMARSMTNWILENGPLVSNDSTEVVGTVFTPQSIVAVRWPWLSLLVLEILLSLVVLIATMSLAHSYDLTSATGSSVPTLCALDPSTRAALGPLSDKRGLEDRIRDTKVRLHRNSLGVPTWLMAEVTDDTYGIMELHRSRGQVKHVTVHSQLLA